MPKKKPNGEDGIWGLRMDMNKKAPEKRIGKKSEFDALSVSERVSLRKFSFAFIFLQSVPIVIITSLIILGGIKSRYFNLQGALVLILGILAVFYVVFRPMSQKIIDSIMVLRVAKKIAKKPG